LYILLKKCKNLIFTILETIFNQILKDGLIPDPFEIAIVSRLHKGKGLKTDLTYYRPISLLNVSSKIFVNAIKTRFLNFLEKNNLLTISQYGFRNGSGTEDALAHPTSVFSDPSKAFNL